MLFIFILFLFFNVVRTAMLFIFFFESGSSHCSSSPVLLA